MCANNWILSNAIALNCTYDIFPFHLVGVVYRCDGKLILDGDSDVRITAVYGTHLDGHQNADVQGLIISSQDMKQFPTNIKSFFPDLKVINFPLNSITSVTNKNLILFPNLEFLALYGNKIASIDSDLFSGLKSLKFINLGRNLIKHVGHNVILPSTAHIYLYSNFCIDRDAVTELEVTYLRLRLMMSCPPQPDSIGSLVNLSISNDKKETLKNKYLKFIMSFSFRDAIIDSKRCLFFEDPSV